MAMESEALMNTSQVVQAACIAFDKGNEEGGVAALVNGVPVHAGQVSRFIEVFRSMANLLEDGAWTSWLAANGIDEREVRSETLEFLVDCRLMEEAAVENGAVAASSEVDGQVALAAEMLGGRRLLEDALASRGLTMELYRRGIEANLNRALLIDRIASAAGAGEIGCGRDGPDGGACRGEQEFDVWFKRYRDAASVVVF